MTFTEGSHETAAEAFQNRPLSAVQRLRRILHVRPEISPLAVILVACFVFQLLNDRFLTAGNISLIFQQVSIIGALAVGQTLVILTAGIDLSIGWVMIFISMTMGSL